MLTIQNHYRLSGRPVGSAGWYVSYCNEQSNFYEIKLVNDSKGLSGYVRLQRKKTLDTNIFNIGKEIYRITNNTDNPTHNYATVTIDYIRDINNLLTSLELCTLYYKLC